MFYNVFFLKTRIALSLFLKNKFEKIRRLLKILLRYKELKMETISYEHFSQVDIRSGTVIKVEPFAKARKPAFKIWVDFGAEIGTLQTSAQVTKLYETSHLVGKQVIGCINLGVKNIAGFVSEFLLLGFSNENGDIALVIPDKDVPNGKKLH